MTNYLLHTSGLAEREYAQQAAADGVITYSYANDAFRWIEPNNPFATQNPVAADQQQSNFIDTIFGYIDSITGVAFQKVEGQRGELHLNFVPTNVVKRFEGDFTNAEVSVAQTEFAGGRGYANGYGQMYSFHNKNQYGALDDIRSIQQVILEAVGVTAPNGNGGDPAFSKDNTLMSFNPGGLNSAGATFFLTADDQAALQALFGASAAPSVGGSRTHVQRIKEDLMIGTDGVVDTFQLTAKGMILKEDSGTQYDDIGTIYNNYNIPYIANFNPGEGDRILIHRSLLDPKTPQSRPSKKLAKPFKKEDLLFKQTFGDKYKSGANVYYNDAGKILMDTNGKRGGLTPSKFGDAAGINGQLVAFVDPIGAEAIPFQSDSLDFFM